MNHFYYLAPWALPWQPPSTSPVFHFTFLLSQIRHSLFVCHLTLQTQWTCWVTLGLSFLIYKTSQLAQIISEVFFIPNSPWSTIHNLQTLIRMSGLVSTPLLSKCVGLYVSLCPSSEDMGLCGKGEIGSRCKEELSVSVREIRGGSQGPHGVVVWAWMELQDTSILITFSFKK